VFWPEEREWLPTAVHDGATLGEGDTIAGPAVVELPHTAVAVPAGRELRRDAVGNLVLTSA
jgi:N-methylhydantoinase A